MLDDLSEENQLKLVSNCGIMLKYISRQSDAVQAAALENDPSASQYIVVKADPEEVPSEQFLNTIEFISDDIISSLEITDDDGTAKANILTILTENYFFRR